eukprot:346635_1
MYEENNMLKDHNKLLTTKLHELNEQMLHFQNELSTNNNDKLFVDKQKRKIEELMDRNKQNEELINEQNMKLETQQLEINRLQTMIGNLAQSKRHSTKTIRCINSGVLNEIRIFNKSYNKLSNDIKH